ncbi:MAG: hypothetical protein OEO21_06420 [Candidatus Krumholzibacteria bacterium]|nr:hypothetical protein [Candidatus Krumholzibacteria bacterium]
MSETRPFWDAVASIRERDDRFQPEAYGLVMDALEYTIARIGERRHIKAAELVRGMCAHVKDRYGVLGFTLIARWGICSAEDFGRAVFQLVEAGMLRRQESDRLEDFEGLFDLRETLEEGYFAARGARPRGDGAGGQR